MLLGVEAFRISETEQARSSLLTEQAQLYAGSIPPRRFGVLSTAFSSDSRTLATATPSTISLWNPVTHRATASVSPPAFNGDEIAYSPSGDSILATDYDGFTLLDSHDLHHQQGSFIRRKLNVADAAMSADGKTVATANLGGTIDLVALPSDRLLRVFKPFSKSTLKVAFDPVDPHILAAVGDHQTVKLIDIRTGAVLEALPGNSDPIYSTAIAFSPDGKLIAYRGIQSRRHGLVDPRPPAAENSHRQLQRGRRDRVQPRRPDDRHGQRSHRQSLGCGQRNAADVAATAGDDPREGAVQP
jgi:WD40 repeat protein